MIAKVKTTRVLLFFVGLFLMFIFVFDLDYVFNGLRATYFRGEASAQIDDGKFFFSSNIRAKKPMQIPSHTNQRDINSFHDLNALLEETKSVAFIVIKDDSVAVESYWGRGQVGTLTNSFSVAKSITSILVGCAIDDGLLDGVDQKVSDFFPEINSDDNLNISHLLQMSSGMDWLENYKRPFSVTAKAYYGSNLKDLILTREFITDPGEVFHYKSGDTQLLGLILEKATGKSVSEYTSDRLWTRIGAKMDAKWSLDSNQGVEKVFCCFHSNARDFAKIGLLVLNNGVLFGDTIVSPNYIKWMTSPVNLKTKKGKETTHYSNSWYYAKVLNKEIIYARGFLGQYIVVIPEINVVFVRLGERENKKRVNEGLTSDLKFIISEVINVYSK